MFQACTPPGFLVYADFKTKDGFGPPESFRGFRETGPMQAANPLWRDQIEACLNLRSGVPLFSRREKKIGTPDRRLGMPSHFVQTNYKKQPAL